MRLPTSFYDAVRAGLRDRLAEAELDGVLVTAPADVAYLAGFFYAVTERPVYLWFGRTAGADVLLLPHLDLEYAQAQDVEHDLELVTYPEYPGVVTPEEHLAEQLRARGVADGALGFSTGVAVGVLDAWRRRMPQARFVPFGGLARMRLRKRPEELVLHRAAAEVCDDMLAAGRALVEDAWRSGGTLPTESEIARHVIGHGTDALYHRFEHVVYTTKLAGGLVYAGPNAARPHGLPSRRRLQEGDTFILSLGAAAGSRFVESERTFVLGEPTAQQRHLFDVALRAQEVGTQAMVVGRRCADVNRTCLDVIRDAGLGEHIRHRQGHGIGIQQHEAPWVEDGDPTVLEAGMVLSSEPGIYVPGHAGYRISDTVLVTDDGPERLTRYPRTLDENVISR